MNANPLLLILFAILIQPAPITAQGFAGLGENPQGFRLPSPNTPLHFPADHGAHPAFRLEWWYVTATLTGTDGADYGTQWTLFRTALRPDTGNGWGTPQIWFAHAALTSATEHLTAETLARGGIGQAGVTTQPFSAWINNWQMAAPEGSTDLTTLALNAAGEGFSYTLTLTAEGPIVLQGDAGYSIKSTSGQASHYYSQPHFTAQGTLHIGTRKIAVSGRAWLDREWSSQPLSTTQTGWDWFALHFDDGAKLMIYRLRDSAAPDVIPATWIPAQGPTQHIPNGHIRLTALAHAETDGGHIPVRWRITWPERGLDITTRPLNPNAWMPTTIPYWEGPLRFDGTATGRGYLEMTGYGEPPN
ncbi:MAG: lipocalin-like domain-containing protein [Qingshengfaniella sp.]